MFQSVSLLIDSINNVTSRAPLDFASSFSSGSSDGSGGVNNGNLLVKSNTKSPQSPYYMDVDYKAAARKRLVTSSVQQQQQQQHGEREPPTTTASSVLAPTDVNNSNNNDEYDYNDNDNDNDDDDNAVDVLQQPQINSQFQNQKRPSSSALAASPQLSSSTAQLLLRASAARARAPLPVAAASAPPPYTSSERVHRKFNIAATSSIPQQQYNPTSWASSNNSNSSLSSNFYNRRYNIARLNNNISAYEINPLVVTLPNGQKIHRSGTSHPPIDEVVLVVLVLLMWVGTVVCFLNSWRKIRVLEPRYFDYKTTQELEERRESRSVVVAAQAAKRRSTVMQITTTATAANNALFTSTATVPGLLSASGDDGSMHASAAAENEQQQKIRRSISSTTTSASASITASLSNHHPVVVLPVATYQTHATLVMQPPNRRESRLNTDNNRRQQRRRVTDAGVTSIHTATITSDRERLLYQQQQQQLAPVHEHRCRQLRLHSTKTVYNTFDDDFGDDESASSNQEDDENERPSAGPFDDEEDDESSASGGDFDTTTTTPNEDVILMTSHHQRPQPFRQNLLLLHAAGPNNANNHRLTRRSADFSTTLSPGIALSPIRRYSTLSAYNSTTLNSNNGRSFDSAASLQHSNNRRHTLLQQQQPQYNKSPQYSVADATLELLQIQNQKQQELEKKNRRRRGLLHHRDGHRTTAKSMEIDGTIQLKPTTTPMHDRRQRQMSMAIPLLRRPQSASAAKISTTTAVHIVEDEASDDERMSRRRPSDNAEILVSKKISSSVHPLPSSSQQQPQIFLTKHDSTKDISSNTTAMQVISPSGVIVNIVTTPTDTNPKSNNFFARQRFACASESDSQPVSNLPNLPPPRSGIPSVTVNPAGTRMTPSVARPVSANQQARRRSHNVVVGSVSATAWPALQAVRYLEPRHDASAPTRASPITAASSAATLCGIAPGTLHAVNQQSSGAATTRRASMFNVAQDMLSQTSGARSRLLATPRPDSVNLTTATSSSSRTGAVNLQPPQTQDSGNN